VDGCADGILGIAARGLGGNYLSVGGGRSVDELLELVAHGGGRKVAAGVVIVEGRLALRVPPFLERTIELGDHWIKRFEVSRHRRGAQQERKEKEEERRAQKKRGQEKTRRKEERPGRIGRGEDLGRERPRRSRHTQQQQQFIRHGTQCVQGWQQRD
jgi:hypothetical protein